MSRKILIIDDEPSIQASLTGALEDEDHEVATASGGREGLDKLSKEPFDIVLLDIWMPEMDGIETLKRIKTEFPDQTVIMMSGHGTIETAVKATKLGAYDFIEKPLSLEKLLVLIHNASQARDLARENSLLRRQIKKQHRLIFKGSPMKEIQELIQQVAPTTGSVLITGENGTGKEVVAHTIHALSTRANKPFIEVNCAAIPEELIESELFGHEKGAFTGATQLRRGKFDLANGGTLFLDEIGDMSLKTQAKILRIIQEQKFERVGGHETISVEVRVVAATNKDLKTEIKRGTFREDLYYRLNVVHVHLPPLRERKDDIQALAEHFLKELSIVHNKKPRKLTTEALKLLNQYTWPGNVRELRNLLERIYILTTTPEDGSPIAPSAVLKHLDDMEEKPSSESKRNDLPKDLRNAKHEFEKEFILKTLEDCDGNVSKAATVLGIERSHLHKKIKTYGIES